MKVRYIKGRRTIAGVNIGDGETFTFKKELLKDQYSKKRIKKAIDNGRIQEIKTEDIKEKNTTENAATQESKTEDIKEKNTTENAATQESKTEDIKEKNTTENAATQESKTEDIKEKK